MEIFEGSTKIISGNGSVAALKDLASKRLFVVADPFFQKNGTVQRIAQASGAQQVQCFADIQPDPSVELAARGTAALKEFNPDLLVALGGGSAMDCAKAMLYFSGSDARFVAIPTTSGSGSEVTDFAILTHNGVKHPLVDKRLRPDIAILDGDLLTQLPRSLISDTGFDVLAHALEAFVAADAGIITDCLAKEAFCTAYALLPASYGGDVSVRLRLHNASAMAGMAFTQAGLGLCHAIAHSLGGMFHVPHGRLNAILLPAVIGCNAHAAGEKYARLAAAAGIGGSAASLGVRNLKNALIRLRRELGMPQTLRDAGVDLRVLRCSMDTLVKTALEDPCCRTNPIRVEGFMIKKVLEEVAGHG
jgi:alcohol dehydrogenase class IV